MGACAAMVALHFLLPLYRWAFWPWNMVGMVPIAFGVVFNLWADREFKRANTTVKPFEESTSLVTGGPFRFSRHPMYVGMTAIHLGLAIVLGSLTPIAPLIAFAFVMNCRFIPVEEKMMRERFGTDYDQYCARVRPWL